jgi:hypothetical protein
VTHAIECDLDDDCTCPPLELGVTYDVSIHVRAGVMEDWSDAEILATTA